MKKVKTSVAKIFAVTTDTTANMNTFGKKLEAMGVCHVYCTDHVLQLTCKQLYEKKDDLEEVLGPDNANSVTKARAIVSFFNQSTQALEKLKTTQSHLDPTCTPLGVVADVVTRWWSTHSMMERLVKLRSSLEIMSARNELGKCTPMDPNDWANLDNMLKILKPFKNAQKFLEGQKYVTASLVALAVTEIRNNLKSIADNPDSVAAEAAANLLKDFEVRWRASDARMFDDTVERAARDRQVGVHPALLIATFLDPRFKSLFSVPDEDSKIAIRDRVLELMKKSEDDHRASLPPATTAAVPNADFEEEKEEEEVVDDMFAAMEAAATTDCRDEANGILSVDDVCSDELKRYMAAPTLKLRTKKVDGEKGFIWHDPLEWWKGNEVAYPILARLARIYLAVQATSAPSERIFSLASRIISARRNRLESTLAGKMLFVSENWEWWQEQ